MNSCGGQQTWERGTKGIADSLATKERGKHKDVENKNSLSFLLFFGIFVFFCG
jgi:hypothetical protein